MTPTTTEETNTEESKSGMTRGQFIASTVAIGLGYFFFGFSIKADNKEACKANAKQLILPPGAQSIEQFSALCTACQLCVNQCPSHVLQPSSIDYGMMAIMQPRMDFTTSFCDYECNRCVEVCPTGALLPLTLDIKKQTKLGTATFSLEKCIVNTENKNCGACMEHCKTKAIKMIPYRNGLKIPQIDTQACIGCGGCEFACVAHLDKAIVINAK